MSMVIKESWIWGTSMNHKSPWFKQLKRNLITHPGGMKAKSEKVN